MAKGKRAGASGKPGLTVRGDIPAGKPNKSANKKYGKKGF